MDEFRKLKLAARKKRDQIIESANREYEQTIRSLADAENLLSPPKKRQRKKTINQLVAELAPHDQPFGVDDLANAIKESYPDRSCARQTIVRAAHDLIKAGSFKKVTLPNHGRKAMYARAELAVEPVKRMIDWAMEIDGWQDMEPVELMVKMTEAGYELESPPKNAVRSLERQLSQSKEFAVCAQRVCVQLM